MVVARIEFRPEHASAFIPRDEAGNQPVIAEVQLDSPEELVETLKQFEFAIKDCIANVDGRIICLSGFKAA